MTDPTPEIEQAAAYLKLWKDSGTDRVRVDLSAECEPWLTHLKPTIIPLYTEAALRSRSDLREWQTIDSAPRDGTWFVAACFGYGDPDYEVGCYDPMPFDKFVEAEGGLYRKEREIIYEWRGFNNFHRATHWMPLPATPREKSDV